MALALVVSIMANIYFLMVLFKVRSKMDAADFWRIMEEPFKKSSNTIVTEPLTNDMIFINGLESIVKDYSDLKSNDTCSFLGVVDNFWQLKLEFSGDEKKCIIFQKSVSDLIQKRVYAVFNFNTPVYVPEFDKDKAYCVVTFFFAATQEQRVSLDAYWGREMALRKQQAAIPIPQDLDLEEQYRNEGL